MPARRKYFTEAEKREGRLAREAAYRARIRAKDPDLYAERTREASRRYRALHPERVSQASMRCAAKNRGRINKARREWRVRNLVRALWLEAKHRAKKRGMEFSITIEDIPPMGACCPLLGHPFPSANNPRKEHSPSVDRINSAKGYIRGNIWIVGFRANLIKNNGTTEEHEQIARAMHKALE